MANRKQTLQERIIERMSKGQLPEAEEKTKVSRPAEKRDKSSRPESRDKNSKAAQGAKRPEYKERTQGQARENDKPGKKFENKPAKEFGKSLENKTNNKPAKKPAKGSCPIVKSCGSCQYQGIQYADQLKMKQKSVEELLGGFCKVEPIIGMKDPRFYRNKVHHVIAKDRRGNILNGFYEERSHNVVSVSECMLEDKKSQEIIATIAGLTKSFKIFIYNEDNGSGLLRHVLVRKGFSTGEIMVVLVCASPIFPSKNNFVKELRRQHPEITTVVLNINDKDTSMVLGERNITLYGPGFIKDTLCGMTFKISPSSFYQINPVQTEKLYGKAIEYAGLTGKETVIDAYCGIGTIGLAASAKAGKVIGVELNNDAVKDARINTRENKVTNAEFYQGDAGVFMTKMAERGEKADIVIMDPPRSGSTEVFIDAVNVLNPEKVVYVSCNPETQARDLKYFATKGYRVRKIQPVDMFPFTAHCETVCLLSRETGRPAKDYVKVGIDAEEYYRIKEGK